MTQEHALQAYKNYKAQLEKSDVKAAWQKNAQHAIDSILIRHPEFADIKEDISGEEEEETPKRGRPKKGE